MIKENGLRSMEGKCRGHGAKVFGSAVKDSANELASALSLIGYAALLDAFAIKVLECREVRLWLNGSKGDPSGQYGATK